MIFKNASSMHLFIFRHSICSILFMSFEFIFNSFDVFCIYHFFNSLFFWQKKMKIYTDFEFSFEFFDVNDLIRTNFFFNICLSRETTNLNWIRITALKFTVCKSTLSENANLNFQIFWLINDNNLFVYLTFHFLHFLNFAFEIFFDRNTLKLFIMRLEIQNNQKIRLIINWKINSRLNSHILTFIFVNHKCKICRINSENRLFNVY